MYDVSENVVITQICGETLLVITGGAEGFTPTVMQLNETGLYLLREIQAGKTMEQLTALFIEEYEAPEEQIRTDVCRLVEELADRKILVKR